MRCLILQGPKLEKCRSYRTKRYINYSDALRPNILVVWGALCGYRYFRLDISGRNDVQFRPDNASDTAKPMLVNLYVF